MVLRTRLRCAPRILGPPRLVRRDPRVSGLQAPGGGQWRRLVAWRRWVRVVYWGWVESVVLVLILFLVSRLSPFVYHVLQNFRRLPRIRANLWSRR